MTEPPAPDDAQRCLSYFDARDVHYLNIQGVIHLLSDESDEAKQRACNALMISFRQLDRSAQQPQR